MDQITEYSVFFGVFSMGASGWFYDHGKSMNWAIGGSSLSYLMVFIIGVLGPVMQ